MSENEPLDAASGQIMRSLPRTSEWQPGLERNLDAIGYTPASLVAA